VGEESLSLKAVNEFAQQVEDLTQLVISELDLAEFSRIGCRVWYLFECKDTVEAEEWLGNLGLYKVSPSLSSGFGGKTQAAGLAVVIESTERKFRVAFNSIERSIPLNLGEGILNIPAHSLPTKQREHLAEQIKQKRRLGHNPPFAAMIDIDAYEDEPKVIEPGDFVRANWENGLAFLSKSTKEQG
jgi:hypothetical protein